MAQLSFGSILQDERERKGYDISSVARRLRIRPDILQALEEGDFTRMPPRGYARNMVNAYARYLGLNPTEITRMYLDEAYADQVKRARSNAQPTGFDMSGAPGGRRAATQRESRPERPAGRVGENGRVLLVDSNTSRYRNHDNDNERLYSGERTHRSTRSAMPGSQYTNFYAGPQAPNAIRSKLPLIIAAAVILVLVTVLLVFLFGPKGDSGDDIQKVPVTGVDDTTQNNGENVTSEEQQSTAPVAPSKVVFEYEVADGQDAWIEIYLNGAEVPDEAGAISGPEKKGFDVAGVLRLDTPRPDAVKVYIDGAETSLTDEDGDGVYSITVDFPGILAQWHTDNPSTGAQTSTGDSAATNNAAA